MAHKDELERGDRFAFGANWSRFIGLLTEEKIGAAENSLCEMLKIESLKGKAVLDIGSGSGLFSLAAKRLGAKVHSFDYDPQSVRCTEELKLQYFKEDTEWTVEEGSVLELKFLERLGHFDVVYSWGVLHHTGQMWHALDNVASRVQLNGSLFLAIYNDQGWISKYWLIVKRVYNRNAIGRMVMTIIHAPYLFGLRYLVRALTGRLLVERGMSLWYDMLDWLGGYPFEVATPEAIFKFFQGKGFVLENLKTCRGRHGCNEFVFRKVNASSRLTPLLQQ
jgi:2-polyprenyl-6-hydroxyphenyl methylase/3-demethylubiquinone-9 3-methyltransferase